MVLSFQTQEVARNDIQEAKLPTALIDVEVRHCPHDSASGVKDALLAHFVLGEAGCSCSSSLIRAMASPFLLQPTDPSTSIITILAQRFWKVPIDPSAWKGNSAKFGCSKQFSEASTRRCRVLVGNSSASLAPYLLDDGRGGPHPLQPSGPRRGAQALWSR